MASRRKRLKTNVDGPFFVDRTCIDCDTCRKLAPEVFDRSDEKSRVYAQPISEVDFVLATRALIACPTASIGTEDKSLLTDVRSAFPDAIDDGVYFCGYTSEKSFGAWSYLIVRSEGNVLVDSPRFAGPLIERIEALGGVEDLFLSHKDDVADHAAFHERFGCRRILHAREIQPDTREVEVQPTGTDPIRLDEDLLMIPVPGHTEGHMVLLYRNKYLFTGDHLAFSAALGHLYAFERFCWYSFDEQRKSMKRLLDYDFEWVLPGHGRPFHAPAAQMREELARCIDWMAGS